MLLLFLLVTPCADPTRQVLPTSSNESGTYDVVLAANLRTYCARAETTPKYIQVLSDLFVQQSIIIPSLVCSYPHPFLILVPQKRHKHMPYFHSFFTLEPFSYRSATWLTLSLALRFRTAERDQLTACLTQ